VAKSYTYRTLVKTLTKHDKKFEFHKNRGKGSERMIFHPDVNGRPESYPIKCHGDNTDIGRGHISAIARRFSLPKGTL